MVLKPGWLNRQFDQVSKNVDAWPEWMKRAAGVPEGGSQMPEGTVTFAALPDRMFCIVCRAALDPVLLGGQYKVPVETGFFEYRHPPAQTRAHEGCPYSGQTFLVKLQLYEAVRVEGDMTTEECVQVIERLRGNWRKTED